ncbi:hypothetical protein GOP47_0003651 [Adiantum capillus-veneris]|uniref:CBF1-interacting co-repressor CIR N-terminal domain-containing protein n=1 Tax=Adiantum capillus-veneris TaxID=13818 RepID=A0A9D4ZLV6_ADICA|nr:hypothetical protein GOP47_0003651 [Adiantum capillus-veneris]
MALKFLNKKGWHTGSLRNIENVWKAEQKHEAEKRKLEELKKQINEEREAQEFRLLQEQAGIVPKQERLEFLYDSGLAVGRSSTDDYLLGKPVEEKKGDDDVTKAAGAPGALFVEEKPQSANDTWRKLHTDPLLLIKQQEQAALARIKNNPVKMDMIKKSVEEKIVKKDKRKQRDEKVRSHKHKRKKKHQMDDSRITNEPKGPSGYEKLMESEGNVEADDYLECRGRSESGNATHTSPGGKQSRSDRGESSQRKHKKSERGSHVSPERRRHNCREGRQDSLHINRGGHADPERRHHKRHDSPDSFNNIRVCSSVDTERNCKETLKIYNVDDGPSNQIERSRQNLKHERRKLTDEERAARLKEMENDAEVHEEQRWHRLKKAFDADQLEEAKRHSNHSSKNFVNQTARSIYGAAKGGSISVEESVRRRTHFIERSIGDSNSNTFQRL